jgi:hypothetical protein
MELAPLSSLRLVVQRSAEATAILGLKAGEQPLVLPNAEWFPDKFSQDHASLELLVARMQGYAGLEHAQIEVVLVGAEPLGNDCGSGACSTGGCGSPKPSAEGPRLSAMPGGYRLEMPAAALNHSIAMTASIARMLGQLRLAEAGRLEVSPELAELAAIALGFGVLLLEASHIYSKGCSGPSVGSATALSASELALPFALFLAREGHKPRPALQELSVTQRSLLDEAWALTQTNRSLVERLIERPADVAAGEFRLVEARSWLSRLFGRGEKSGKDRDERALAALERGENLDHVAALLASEPKVTTRARQPREDDAELRQLVDEALGELRPGAASHSPAE